MKQTPPNGTAEQIATKLRHIEVAAPDHRQGLQYGRISRADLLPLAERIRRP